MDTYLTLENKSIIKSEYLNDEVYNLLDNTFNIPEYFIFDVIKVEPNYTARPDLLSYDIYGSDIYADIICKLNGISNPFEFNEGEVIVVPNISDIHNFIIKPSISELEKDTVVNNAPKAKQKQEKRKPNDAIIGDKRFTIDTKKRVIIY